MVELSKVKRGQVFSMAEHEWIVVEHNEEDGTTLVTTTDCISDMAFDENNSNDFRNSSLRKYLNSDFLEELLDGGLEIDDVMYTDFDLTGHQGGDYGICRDLIGLLTEDQYKEHKDILVIDDWWWLITPYSGGSDGVRNVNSGGSLSYRTAYSGYLGVRPALTLDSEAMVTIEESHKSLEDYSSEELLQELLRREN